jgi:hypothetical protein
MPQSSAIKCSHILLLFLLTTISYTFAAHLSFANKEIQNLKPNMKKSHPIKLATAILFSVLLSNLVMAQAPVDKSKRPSQPALAIGKIGSANITVDYSSPSVKGRKIFGGILPYGTLWRAGANEATIFSTDKDITVEGKKLPAGKYSFFTTPSEKKWTVFFNSENRPVGR